MMHAVVQKDSRQSTDKRRQQKTYAAAAEEIELLQRSRGQKI